MSENVLIDPCLGFSFTMNLKSAYSLLMAFIDCGRRTASYFFASVAVFVDPYSKLTSECSASISNADHWFKPSTGKRASRCSQSLEINWVMSLLIASQLLLPSLPLWHSHSTGLLHSSTGNAASQSLLYQSSALPWQSSCVFEEKGTVVPVHPTHLPE